MLDVDCGAVLVSRHLLALLHYLVKVGPFLARALPVEVALRPFKFSRTLVAFHANKDALGPGMQLPLDHLCHCKCVVKQCLDIPAASMRRL